MGDGSLALLDILHDDVFGDVSDAASGSADSDSHEDSDRQPGAQRVYVDDTTETGRRAEENVVSCNMAYLLDPSFDFIGEI